MEAFYLHHNYHLADLQEVVTLKTDMVQNATANILELHSIPAAVSKDLAAVLLDERFDNSSRVPGDIAGARQP